MDYKYIEQLLDRYWTCSTTPAEERILRDFFSQPDVPASLSRYKDLFVYERQQAEVRLGADFDERLLRLAGAEEKPVVKARPLTLRRRVRPLFRAAAAVAIVALLGTASQRAFRRDAQPAWDYNAAAYQDSYDNPQEAYEVLDDGLQDLRDLLGPERSAQPDSARVPNQADRR